MTSAREAGQRRKAFARGLTMALHMCSPLIPWLLPSSPPSGRKCILLSENLFFDFPLMDRQWPRRGEGGGRGTGEGKERNVCIFSLSLSQHESTITISMFSLSACLQVREDKNFFFLRFLTILQPFCSSVGPFCLPNQLYSLVCSFHIHLYSRLPMAWNMTSTLVTFRSNSSAIHQPKWWLSSHSFSLDTT